MRGLCCNKFIILTPRSGWSKRCGSAWLRCHPPTGEKSWVKMPYALQLVRHIIDPSRWLSLLRFNRLHRYESRGGADNVPDCHGAQPSTLYGATVTNADSENGRNVGALLDYLITRKPLLRRT